MIVKMFSFFFIQPPTSLRKNETLFNWKYTHLKVHHRLLGICGEETSASALSWRGEMRYTHATAEEVLCFGKRKLLCSLGFAHDFMLLLSFYPELSSRRWKRRRSRRQNFLQMPSVAFSWKATAEKVSSWILHLTSVTLRCENDTRNIIIRD